MQKLIETTGIRKSYGDFLAVDNLNFTVQAGEIFALLGPNGSGKSTTIRMILDIIRPDTGAIKVFGEPLSEAGKDKIGYLPEERGLYKTITVLETMVYLGKLKGLQGAEAKRRSLDYLERFGLSDVAKKKVSELSKGMQQKVQFAVTVMHDPQLIIIDEPFSGLDPINRLMIKDLLTDFRARGGAVVMSTHQMNQVEELADRLLMISKGQQKLYGEVNAIRYEYAKHAIIVEGTGDWGALAGVTHIEDAPNSRNAKVLHLDGNTTSDNVLAAIAGSSAYTIDRFERAIPSLDEVFIRVAGEKSA